jgi:hypothetical protein
VAACGNGALIFPRHEQHSAALDAVGRSSTASVCFPRRARHRLAAALGDFAPPRWSSLVASSPALARSSFAKSATADARRYSVTPWRVGGSGETWAREGDPAADRRCERAPRCWRGVGKAHTAGEEVAAPEVGATGRNRPRRRGYRTRGRHGRGCGHAVSTLCAPREPSRAALTLRSGWVAVSALSARRTRVRPRRSHRGHPR